MAKSYLNTEVGFIGLPNQLVTSGKIVELTGTAVKLYVVLCKFANSEGKAFPGRKRLAEICGVSERSISSAVTELEESGMLYAHQILGKGNTYTITNSAKWKKAKKPVDNYVDKSCITTSDPGSQLLPPGKYTSPHPGSQLPTNKNQLKRTIYKEPIKREEENVNNIVGRKRGMQKASDILRARL